MDCFGNIGWTTQEEMGKILYGHVLWMMRTDTLVYGQAATGTYGGWHKCMDKMLWPLIMEDKDRHRQDAIN